MRTRISPAAATTHATSAATVVLPRPTSSARRTPRGSFSSPLPFRRARMSRAVGAERLPFKFTRTARGHALHLLGPVIDNAEVPSSQNEGRDRVAVLASGSIALIAIIQRVSVLGRRFPIRFRGDAAAVLFKQ